jgi:pimeloyl-ACP methyl ester carboxylesterase
VFVDRESRFLTCEGVEIHYKLIRPENPPPPSDAAPPCLVLIHGFGGGVFSWRLIARAIANRCNCSVLLMDRPGFGLSERPYRHSFPDHANPYAITTQVRIVLSLAQQLGLKRLLLAGHADGALLALLAARAAAASIKVRPLVHLAHDVVVDFVHVIENKIT